MYCLDDYDYELPASLIAQAPLQKREFSRLLVLNRSASSFEHRRFQDLCGYLRPGDVIVVNDTQVVQARLSGTKETGGRAELLIMDPYKDADLGRREGYQCLIKASKKPRVGSVIHFSDAYRAEVLSSVTDGQACVRFLSSKPFLAILEEIGEVPLPPYIRREGKKAPVDDANCYQTVYACKPGAVAAPTAGLHFSAELLQELENRGVEPVRVTLHVGYGTFSPIRVRDIRQHSMHPEYAEISPEAAERIEMARRENRRIVAVGTTVVRILEWVARESGEVASFSGFCNHYIFPGYRFRVVKAMITNFHLPKSTLLLLVSAFAGREAILSAYREAVREKYRFFSYGDAMLIL